MQKKKRFVKWFVGWVYVAVGVNPLQTRNMCFSPVGSTVLCALSTAHKSKINPDNLDNPGNPDAKPQKNQPHPKPSPTTLPKPAQLDNQPHSHRPNKRSGLEAER